MAGDNGDRPTAYIAGEEGSGAIVVGLRYGKGLLYMRATSRWRSTGRAVGRLGLGRQRQPRLHPLLQPAGTRR